MKEYLAREDLEYFLKDKYGDEVLTSQDFDGMFKEIQEFNTVTRADIVNDFCKWLKNKRFTLNTMDEIVVNINDEWKSASEVYIAELEQTSVEEYDTREYAKQNPEWAKKIKRLAEMEG